MKRFLSEITTVVERLSFNMSVKNVVRSINTDRPFEIPDDENEVLTILDDLGIIRSRVCPRTCSIDVYDAVLDKMRDGMARIDYAHIIQGKDIGLTIYQLNNVYYDRKRDLARCGRSWRLIAIYLKKSSIELFDNDQLEEIVNKATRADFRSSQKYKDALEYNLCDENGVLLVTKAKYTRFAVAKYKIDTQLHECIIPFRIEFGTPDFPIYSEDEISIEVTITVPSWYLEHITPDFNK